MFYRLCSGAPQQMKSKLGITKAEDFLVCLVNLETEKIRNILVHHQIFSGSD